MTWIILPNQIFNTYKKENGPYVLWEHPSFFKKYKFNKKKLILHRASMKAFYDNLEKKDFDIKYVNFNEQHNINHTDIYYDTINNIQGFKTFKFVESPNFLLSNVLLNEYRDKTQHFRFNNFYMWSKKKLNVLPDQKSTDLQNRKKPTDDIINKKMSVFKNHKSSHKYIKEAISYVEKHFSDNYGNTTGFNFPITRREALQELRIFIKKKLPMFGDYQDYTLFKEIGNGFNSYNMFHSLLSSSINIGLINPGEIIYRVLKTCVAMNNKEGFIRQLFWREYQRYTYLYVDWKKYLENPYLSHVSNLTREHYTGNTGISPIDICIKKAFDTAYLHHIERLMIIGNYFSIVGIKPESGFRWFMEFSCDSYEWVMYQNVYDMVFFVTGGLTMTRPYNASSNYLRKMSNITQIDREKTYLKIDKLYKKFISRNNKKLYKFRYYFPTLKFTASP